MKTTRRLNPASGGLETATELLRGGGLVAFPTETVYGLGGDARNGESVARIYEAKGRPSFNPLIVHVASAAHAQAFGLWNDAANRLAAAFWPGPLTLVVPLKPASGLSTLVTAGLDSVALRVPASPLARQLLQTADCPVAAPSANRSGKISPTTAAHVLSTLDGRIDAVLDGGACDVGLESTIVGVTGAPTLLRAGGLAKEQIEAELGAPLCAAGPGIIAPGQLTSHYAPGAQVRLNAVSWQPGERRLGFGDVPCDLNLFGHLHRLDALGGDVIAVSPIPMHGLGHAINDRLHRAAAPRA